MGLIDYARISTIEGAQVLDRQFDALNAAGCERIFEDRASGARAEHPGLAMCLDFLRKGDVLVVLDLDRPGRLAGELIPPIDQLEGRSIAFRALNAPIDTTTPTGRAFLQIQAAFAEMERNIIRLPLAPNDHPALRATVLCHLARKRLLSLNDGNRGGRHGASIAAARGKAWRAVAGEAAAVGTGFPSGAPCGISGARCLVRATGRCRLNRLPFPAC